VSRRIVVIGGTGLFGGAAADLLSAEGMAPLVAARRAARDGGRPPGLRLDAEDPAALRAALRPGDIVLDAAGPFQKRSAALVETALDVGCDVIDLSDSLGHFLKIDALRPQIEAKGIRVLTSCSSVTTLIAAIVRASGAKDPVRVSVYLSPASQSEPHEYKKVSGPHEIQAEPRYLSHRATPSLPLIVRSNLPRVGTEELQTGILRRVGGIV